MRPVRAYLEEELVFPVQGTYIQLRERRWHDHKMLQVRRQAPPDVTAFIDSGSGCGHHPDLIEPG